jgi:hypothetical protein
VQRKTAIPPAETTTVEKVCGIVENRSLAPNGGFGIPHLRSAGVFSLNNIHQPANYYSPSFQFLWFYFLLKVITLEHGVERARQ